MPKKHIVQRGAGLGQWWEQNPPTNEAQDQFQPDAQPFVGQVCSRWTSSLCQGVFSKYSSFPSARKKTNGSKSSSNLERGPTGNPAWADVASLALYSNLIFITFRFLKAKDTKTLHLPIRFPLHFIGVGGMY